VAEEEIYASPLPPLLSHLLLPDGQVFGTLDIHHSSMSSSAPLAINHVMIHQGTSK